MTKQIVAWDELKDNSGVLVKAIFESFYEKYKLAVEDWQGGNKNMTTAVEIIEIADLLSTIVAGYVVTTPSRIVKPGSF